MIVARTGAQGVAAAIAKEHGTPVEEFVADRFLFREHAYGVAVDQAVRHGKPDLVLLLGNVGDEDQRHRHIFAAYRALGVPGWIGTFRCNGAIAWSTG